MGCSDRDLLDLADRQHGVVALGQARDLGCTRAQLRRLLGAGALVREGPKVYGVPSATPTFERRVAAALLGLGPDAVVSHLAAARLHGLVGDAEPEVTVPRSRRNAVAAVAVHATDTLATDECVEIDGLRCTTLVRTILDLAATDLPTAQLRTILDRSGVDRHELHRALQQRRGRGTAGVSRLDAVLADAGTVVERRFLAALRRDGLPRPHRIPDAPRPTFRFAGYGVAVALEPTACDWTSIARLTRQALRDAGWPRRGELRRAA